jgi:peptide-methionine (S)-S-oxide reductase
MFLINMLKNKMKIPAANEALPGRPDELPTAEKHFVKRTALKGPFPEHLQQVMFGLGCFWGAERLFWEMDGVWTTAVGYAAGHTPNPTYQETCTGLTGHNEVVLVVYDPKIVSYEMLLKKFWESHDPTQGMRQGNDTGTQYRSGIYTYSQSDKELAIASRKTYQTALDAAGKGVKITTEILEAPTFYYAEEYHQQYLAKNPDGYCGIGGTGVSCPIGTGVAAE